MCVFMIIQAYFLYGPKKIIKVRNIKLILCVQRIQFDISIDERADQMLQNTE